VARDGLGVNHLAIPNLRGGVVNNSNNLLPSTCERAKGVPEGHVLSTGEPVLQGSGFRSGTHLSPGCIARSFLNVFFRSHLDHSPSYWRPAECPRGLRGRFEASSPLSWRHFAGHATLTRPLAPSENLAARVSVSLVRLVGEGRAGMVRSGTRCRRPSTVDQSC
jgi:hypothetical protein